jgi:hypothetical protein
MGEHPLQKRIVIWSAVAIVWSTVVDPTASTRTISLVRLRPLRAEEVAGVEVEELPLPLLP